MKATKTFPPPLSGALLGIAAAAVLLACCMPASAQDTRSSRDFVAGIVTDRVTKEPVCGVSVYFEGYDYGEITDENG